MINTENISEDGRIFDIKGRHNVCPSCRSDWYRNYEKDSAKREGSVFMGVSEEKLKNLISSIQAPIICDAMNLWYIQHSLDILHAILVVHPVTPYPVEAPEFTPLQNPTLLNSEADKVRFCNGVIRGE